MTDDIWKSEIIFFIPNRNNPNRITKFIQWKSEIMFSFGAEFGAELGAELGAEIL